MTNKNQVQKLLEITEELQHKVYSRNIDCDYNSLRFSCDLLLRNMAMVLSLDDQDKTVNDEMKYLESNILGAYAHLTGENAIKVAKKYNLFY
ncbi:hypothetical protein ACQCU1_03475 [Sutcliffiella horikoshii]|uniref:hypothetical protein n=1 Tax=Sutcliffiella horikoshii TaxID=79883 RepID=UPI003CEA2EC6